MAAPRKPKSMAAGKGKTKTTTTKKAAKVADTVSATEAVSFAEPATNGNGAGSLISTTEMIRLRAYEIFLERNGNGGDEVSDWLAAERELMEKL